MHQFRYFSFFSVFATLHLAACLDHSEDVGSRDLGDAPQIPITHASNPTSSCTNPIVRKEWRAMTSEQKKSWIDAIKCLASQPSDQRITSTNDPMDSILPPYNRSSSAYDDFAYLHADFNNRVHLTGLFFPFHRYFSWSFERTLQQRCNYTGSSPYWDWTQDTEHFGNASIFDPDPEIGHGGFGKKVDNFVVPDGAFSHFQLAYPYPHELRREYTPSPYTDLNPPFVYNKTLHSATTFTREEVQKVVNGFRGDFQGMQTYVEDIGRGMHLAIHVTTGGDFGGDCPKDIPGKDCVANTTPNDPLFWIHHAMVDKIWWDWQNSHPDNALAFGGGSVRDVKSWPKYPTGGPPAIQMNYTFVTDGILFGNHTVGDMMSTTSGMPLCYIYE